MLTKVEVRTSFGTLLTLTLKDPSNGYSVGKIDGLDPVKATLVFSSYAGQDGSEFQSAKRENRNIVLGLGYEPEYATMSVASLRQNLYKFLMPKSVVQLRFYDTEITEPVNITGRVESHDSPRFTRDPDATISLICENSDFDTLSTVTFGGMTTSGSTTTDQEYVGTIETGFLFTLNVDRTIAGFTLYNTLPDNTVRSLTLTAPMVAGDVLRISTIPGNKYARLTHSGVESSVLYGVLPASDWLNLFPGLNKIRVLLAGAGVPWTIDYTDKYGGL